MTKVLLTGAAGFIGHHCLEHWLTTTDWDIVAVDSLTYAGDPHRFADMEGFDPDRVKVIWHDLRSPLVDHTTADRIGDVDYIVSMAAESHVERSIHHPVEFFTNNTLIALNVLEYARLRQPHAKVIQVSTDEVYGPAAVGTSHVEWDTIRPSNPYAGSKAAQEAAAFSYWRTYGLKVAITNTMNNFGERQHPEKFVPMAIKRLLGSEPVPVHGRPTYGTKSPTSTEVVQKWVPSSRVWLHARNHADALRFLLDEVPFPTYDPHSVQVEQPVRFNVAGEREIGVDQIVNMIADSLGVASLIEWVDFHSSRPGHDLRYSLNGDALAAAGWTPPVPLDESFDRTVKWYLNHPEWLGL